LASYHGRVLSELQICEDFKVVEGGKSLLWLQMILLAHLEAGVEKKRVTAVVIVMVTAQIH
jgi:hypothetical protein